jgi:hypothetical protein
MERASVLVIRLKYHFSLLVDITPVTIYQNRVEFNDFIIISGYGVDEITGSEKCCKS